MSKLKLANLGSQLVGNLPGLINYFSNQPNGSQIKVDPVIDGVTDSINDLFKSVRNALPNSTNQYASLDETVWNNYINKINYSMNNGDIKGVTDQIVELIYPAIFESVKTNGTQPALNFIFKMIDFRKVLVSQNQMIQSGLVQSLRDSFQKKSPFSIVSFNGARSLRDVSGYNNNPVSIQYRDIAGHTIGKVTVNQDVINLLSNFQGWKISKGFQVTTENEFISVFGKYDTVTSGYTKSPVTADVYDLYPVYQKMFM